MKLPPGITEADITHLLAEHYGVLADGLRYIPTDWTPYNYGYAVRTGEDERFFIKYYGATADPYPARSRRFFIPLTHVLHKWGIIPNVPYPIRARDGGLWVAQPGWMAVLQPFINGTSVGFDGYPDYVVHQLATALGTMHRDSAELSFEYPLYETYNILFEADLNRLLGKITEYTFNENETLHKLAGIMQQHSEIWQRALEFVRRAPSTEPFRKDKVVCHTDLHGGNMMLNQNHQLYILDWENALIAPPEHDLFFYAGEDDFWDCFWPRYIRAYGKIPQLEPEVFRYYYYRRALEDVTGYVARITSCEGNAMRDADDLEELEAILKGLPSADVTVQSITKRLQMMER